ncbi:MAG: hypothetical protein MOB07_05810 [Acidobacteria bacterium]|nr:hypothetical protein [Acidobacteriota bacterium]
MTTAQEQIKPETAALIASLAAANGLSVDDYLRHILEEVAQAHGMDIDAYLKSVLAARNGQRQAEPLNLAELERTLDELSEGAENITPLPPGLSRADIYGDHP